MKKEKAEEIILNTEAIKSNTEDIKETGIKTYNQERHKRIWDALFYSHQRIDTLLITISGAGIYLCLETIKFYSNKSTNPHWLIKVSAILLLLAIISNFISQLASSKMHALDYSILDIEVTCEEDKIDKSIYNAQIIAFEKKIYCLEKVNKFFSSTAIFLMSLGLTAIVTFFCFIF